MHQETTAELKNIRQELQQINQRLDGNDQRFEKIDQRFEKIDQRFEKIDQRFEKIDQRFEKIDQRFDTLDQRLGRDFRIVHDSINKLATDLYKKCLDDDHKHADLKAMFDTFMHRTNGMESVPVLEKMVEGHDLRISNLEAARKN